MPRHMHSLVVAVALAATAARAASEAPASAPSPAPAPAAAPGALASSTGDWRDARWGMSVEQVLAAFPGEAVRISPEVKLADGNVLAVGIDGYTFEGLRLQVRFIFSDGKLALVSLRTPQDKYPDAAAFEKLEKALVDRWGPPIETSSDRNFIEQRQTRWKSGQSFVDLKYIPGVMVILYHPTVGVSATADAPAGATSPAREPPASVSK